MNLRSLPAILRTLVPEESFEDDAELLRRFGEERSEIAFAALVRRHGRLVWTVCRNLTGSDTDADDAFQATFVVLLKNAKSIRDPARLSPWLHGVAFKVCTKTRQSQQLRTKREESTAQVM